MKKLLFFCVLLSMLMMTVFSSCKKEEDVDESYEIQVSVENHRQDVVYLYIDGSFKDMIVGGHTWNGLYKTKDGDSVKFEIRNSSGEVLHSKSVRKGETYNAVLNTEGSNSDSNSESTEGTDSIDPKNEWTLPIEIKNNTSSSVYVFINGKAEELIKADNTWKVSYTITNQNSVTVEVRDANAKLLLSKTVSKGNSLVTTVAPTFTITKIVLTKWNSGNWLDNPDPWFEVLVNGSSVGRTSYLSDRTDGELCTWSNLSIKISNIYSKVTLDLYDYNLGYSSVGSSYIGGIVASDFSVYRGMSSFEWKTSSMAFTIYGTWN
ncbi:MAG: hypothetical protein MJZ14_03565 [Paludibacteraceae bacterium]|nr:hypothetical protein [Paludibacteraceae bacterium]